MATPTLAILVRARCDVHRISSVFFRQADLAAEIAFAAEHCFNVVRCFFGKESRLFLIQNLFLLLRDERQVFFDHIFDFTVLRVDADGEFGF